MCENCESPVLRWDERIWATDNITPLSRAYSQLATRSEVCDPRSLARALSLREMYVIDFWKYFITL